jgi:hypothetical protein
VRRASVFYAARMKIDDVPFGITDWSTIEQTELASPR